MENYHRKQSLKLINMLEKFTNKVVDNEKTVVYNSNNVYILNKIYSLYEEIENNIRIFIESDDKKIQEEIEEDKLLKKIIGPSMILYTTMNQLKDENK